MTVRAVLLRWLRPTEPLSDAEGRLASCGCLCHAHEGTVHARPCCEVCPRCGERFLPGWLRTHDKTCPVPVPARESRAAEFRQLALVTGGIVVAAVVVVAVVGAIALLEVATVELLRGLAR